MLWRISDLRWLIYARAQAGDEIVIRRHNDYLLYNTAAKWDKLDSRQAERDVELRQSKRSTSASEVQTMKTQL